MLLLAGHAALASTGSARGGYPLVHQVLDDIAKTGIHLIYSSQLVPPDLRSAQPVRGRTPLQRLHSLLAPLGLIARRVAAGTYVIEAAPQPGPRPPGRSALPMLGQVVVQTSRYRSNLLASRTATRAALESSPETHNDAVRALQVIPGTTAAGYTARTHVRGSRDDEVQFRYDGVTLHEPYHLKELQSLFSPVDPTAVSSVTSWTGIAPIEYGNDIGGVVSMRPRRITRTTGDFRLSEQGASAMAGTVFDRRRGSVFADLRLQNQFAPVGWIDSGIGKPTLNDLIVHATWELGSHTRLAAGVLAIDDHRKYFSTENAASKGVAGGETYAWLRLEHWFAPTLRSLTILSGEQSHENVSGSANQPYIVTGSLLEHSWHSIYTLREELRGTPARRWYWHLGAEASRVSLVDRSAGSATFAPPFFPGLQPTATVTANEAFAAHALTYALYGSLRWQAGRRATVDLGVRRNARHYVGGPSDSQWNVRANLRYQLTRATALRLGWGQETQAGVLDPHIEAGHFDPQDVRRLTQTDFSVNHHFPARSAVRAELYYKDEGSPQSYASYAFSPFALLPELAVDKIHVVSQRSRMYGVELSFETNRARPLSGTISYVWSRAEDLVGGVWTPRAWDEPSAIKVNALWRHAPFAAAASLTWHSGWPYTPLLASTTHWTDPATVQLAFGRLDGSRLGNFFTLDMRFSWQHRVARGIFEAFLNVYDMTNSASACCTSYSVARSAAAVYSLSETHQPWLTLTPVFGVRWHF